MLRKSLLNIAVVCGLLCFGAVGIQSVSVAHAASEAAAAGDKSMANVQLILKKLRNSLANMKDFDALEDAGMDKVDVDKMRRAMKQKIQQMTADAVDMIRLL